MLTFGEKLTRVRESAGLSQSALALRADISLDSLRNWEQDKAQPRVFAMRKLLAALDTTFEEFTRDIVEGKAKGRPAKRKGKAKG